MFAVKSPKFIALHLCSQQEPFSSSPKHITHITSGVGANVRVDSAGDTQRRPGGSGPSQTTIGLSVGISPPSKWMEGLKVAVLGWSQRTFN